MADHTDTAAKRLEEVEFCLEQTTGFLEEAVDGARALQKIIDLLPVPDDRDKTSNPLPAAWAADRLLNDLAAIHKRCEETYLSGNAA